jgi:hypothetical protein
MMMPDKIPSYRFTPAYRDDSGLTAYLRAEWGAGRGFLKGGGGEKKPSVLTRLRLIGARRPLKEGVPTSRLVSKPRRLRI